MKHPSEYTTVQLGNMHFMIVDPGTIITDERSGQQAIIEGKNFAVKNKVVFCTDQLYQLVKNQYNDFYSVANND